MGGADFASFGVMVFSQFGDDQLYGDVVARENGALLTRVFDDGEKESERTGELTAATTAVPPQYPLLST